MFRHMADPSATFEIPATSNPDQMAENVTTRRGTAP
jgi:hypothetical protein